MTGLPANYIRRIRAAVAQRGMSEEQKCAMVAGATGSRTEHISEMTEAEAIALLNGLNGKADNYEPGTKQRLKRKILAIAHDLKWELPDGKVDMARVNGYCLTKSRPKKEFDKLTTKELEEVVKQFGQMKKGYSKK